MGSRLLLIVTSRESECCQDRGSAKGLGFRFGTAPPLGNSWRIIVIWLYIALTRTPNIDCYWGGGGGSTQGLGFRVRTSQLPALMRAGRENI